VLAGGRAERLGAAAQGRPKPLVTVGGRSLAEYQISLLAAAGVHRVIFSCAAGQGERFHQELRGAPVDVATVEEPRPLGRGGGLRFAAAARAAPGDVYALNGDELLDVDLSALLARHLESRAAATIAVARPLSPYGVVDLGEDDLVAGFGEGARVTHWVSCGVYVLGEEAVERLPDIGDHETTTFPELAAERRLQAFRHDGVWLTVNTPKDLRRAEDYLAAHPDWPLREAPPRSAATNQSRDVGQGPEHHRPPDV
jgi:NDP-sugar pyrophosphorylase family protein